MCSKFQSSEATGRGVYTFHVNGKLCHHIGNLEPEVNHGANLFLDDGLQTERRMEIFDDLDHNTINNIQEVLELINAFVRGFKSSRDVFLGGHNMGLRIFGEAPIGKHRRRYN